MAWWYRRNVDGSVTVFCGVRSCGVTMDLESRSFISDELKARGWVWDGKLMGWRCTGCAGAVDS